MVQEASRRARPRGIAPQPRLASDEYRASGLGAIGALSVARCSAPGFPALRCPPQGRGPGSGARVRGTPPGVGDIASRRDFRQPLDALTPEPHAPCWLSADIALCLYPFPEVERAGLSQPQLLRRHFHDPAVRAVRA